MAEGRRWCRVATLADPGPVGLLRDGDDDGVGSQLARFSVDGQRRAPPLVIGVAQSHALVLDPGYARGDLHRRRAAGMGLPQHAAILQGKDPVLPVQ